jgi:hypothetical protein
MPHLIPGRIGMRGLGVRKDRFSAAAALARVMGLRALALGVAVGTGLPRRCRKCSDRARMPYAMAKPAHNQSAAPAKPLMFRKAS